MRPQLDLTSSHIFLAGLLDFFRRGYYTEFANEAAKGWTREELDPDSPEVISRLGSYLEFGDEVWFVSSPRRDWARLQGRAGYVIIRDNKIVHFEWSMLS